MDILSFNEFITEAATTGISNDDKGKMHELLLAKHLHPKGKLPEHHRAVSDNPEHSGTPEQVHERLKAKIGSDAYNEIHKHAKQTADEVKKHIPKGHTIHTVHWTSNRDTEKKAGDHEKTTGHKDVNSNADLIVTSHNKKGKAHFHPVSAKYGSNAQPNYKNAGLNSLESHSGKKGLYTKLQKAHETHMSEIGYKGSVKERHAQYKADKVKLDAEKKTHKSVGEFKPKSKEAKRAHAAEHSSVTTRTAMAKEHTKGMSKKSDAELRQHIKDQVSPPTKHPHIIAHSRVHDDGSATSHVHAADSVADEHLKNFKNLHVKHSGISSTIHGTYHNPGHKDHGKVKAVATQIFKASSGPHKGTAGAFSLR
jgi:hypothetical protein